MATGIEDDSADGSGGCPAGKGWVGQHRDDEFFVDHVAEENADIGALDANAGCGVWARIRKVSAMPAERLPLASGTQSAKNARDLLKEAKSLDLPTPLIPATETPRERKL